MSKREKKSVFSVPILFLAVLVCAGVIAASSAAGPRDRERIMVSLDLFPSLLAADRAIARKTGPDGKLHLLLVYRNDRESLQPFVDRLQRVGTIRNIPIQVTCIRFPLEDTEEVVPAGLFIIQHLGRAEIRRVVRFGEEHQVVTFSPFAGDVEEGVLAGISITDQIQPYVNLATMERASIRLKPFFLRIAKTYASDKAQ